MDHTLATLEAEQHVGGGTKEIWRVTIYLSVLTLLELSLGIAMMYMQDDSFGKDFTKGVIVILMLVKAFYIVGYFMHLKHEVRNLVMTVIVPLFLFVWFIIAFLSDGNSYKNLRNRYDRYQLEKSQQKAPAKQEESNTHKME